MKLIILSYPFYGYGKSIAKAFRLLGHEVAYCEYAVPDKGVEAILRYSIPRRFGLDVETTTRKNYGRQVSDAIRSFRPDGILIVRGDFYTEFIETAIKSLPKRPKIAIWVMDGIKRVPKILEFRNCIDRWFVFEPTDVPVLKQDYGIKSEFLPLAFDPDYYHPLAPTTPDKNLKADISFVGSIMDVGRQKMINLLAKWSRVQGLDFKIISGTYRTKYHPHLFINRYLRKCLWKTHLEHPEINILYNNCQANLNIHARQSLEGLNMRFFEILGSGGLQIVERQKSQTELGFVPDRDFLTYSDLGELEEKIKFSMEHPDEVKKIAKSGHQQVKNHDFLSRAKFLMEEAFN